MVAAMQGGDAVQSRLGSAAWQEIDRAEEVMRKFPQQEMPLRHVFTPGLYTREITMPAGTLLTSRIHLFEHPFVISKGAVSVWSDEHGWERFQAPYLGITKPGTRRVLYIHEETVWTTFHVTNETDPDKIGLQITYTGGEHARLGLAAKKENPPCLT